MHINELELTAALHAINSFVHHARNRHVLLVSDSMVTVHIVRNLTTRSPRLLSKIRTLRALCEKQGITLSTRHLPSVVNKWADRLSRRRDTNAWNLSDVAIKLIQRMCIGRQLHPYNRMASASSSQTLYTRLQCARPVLPY